MDVKKLENLLSQMTIDEKVGQLMQFAVSYHLPVNDDQIVTGPMSLQLEEEDLNQSGSVLGGLGAEKNREIQERYLKQSRLKIPLLFMTDVINGYKTIFPIPLGLGASWDPALVEEAQAIAAKEASSAGIHVTFAPMVDLVRDPRWGRVMESTGEDPYLNAEFSKATVRGLQGEDLKNELDRLAACVKHFIGYGAAEGGRDYNTVDISPRELKEHYLPAFTAALDAGCKLVMAAFNTVNSIPATANKHLNRDLLKGELKFDGVLISDFGAVEELIPHGVAADHKEAADKSIAAGIDIEMMSTCYKNHLKELVEEGAVSIELLDEAVFRILKLKDELGLFENPFRNADVEREKEIIFCDKHRELSRRAAEKCCVLLKNNDFLPLSKGENIALIGPYANNQDLLGEWSIYGEKEKAITLNAGVEQHTSNYNYSKGSHMYERSELLLEEAVAAANQSSCVVLALGEGSDRSGEARSRSSIELPECQLELLRELKKTNKPIVVVLFNARPLVLGEVNELADVIIEAWHPGSEGGSAVANILFGKVNPSGKLTMSYPRVTGQIPVYYNAYNTGRPLPKGSEERFVSKYIDIPNDPLYPFGYGLSYSTFTYDYVKLSSNILDQDGSIIAEVNVTNRSEVAGEEIVQMYISDLAAEVVRPVKELKDFRKVAIDPWETQTVIFKITEDMLKYHHADLAYKSDPGHFELLIGPDSSDGLKEKFELV